ncbi:MAG: sigma-54 dependent transcriptional regulator [Bacteroidales bacterium]|nr:sigma-54 dependent transcriptional regulator [Bacteroidales bacterium]
MQYVNSSPFLGNSTAMQKVFRTIEKVAQTEASVLILGENGTGKELVAQMIHQQSPRKINPFIRVDLGSVTETLFESEVFGHVKGAYTDARTDRAGRFELANTGSIFLDEIGNLSKMMQCKLLTALELRQVTRVGESRPRNIDIRLISATNNNLKSMIEKGDFRQDLLYRINTVEINLPPLRQRDNDIILLLDYFIAFFAEKYQKKIEKLSDSIKRQLLKYTWPGNVRELLHVTERAVIMAENNVVSLDDFGIIPEYSNSMCNMIGNEEFEDYNLEHIELNTIKKVLTICNNQIKEAAKILGLSSSSLYRRLEKYSIDINENGREI